MASQPPHPLLLLARRTVQAQAEGRNARATQLEGRGAPQACFVSLHAGTRLRGCIGTLKPSQPSVEQEVIENAIAAATRDPRFSPVRPDEVAGLHLSIDLLEAPEPVQSAADLDPKEWGCIVREGSKSGVLLPDIPNVRTAAQQIEICREKAGIAPDAPVTLARFRVQRLEE
ncbi:MAG TPA: AmmeMemoRadiSam system protein A [bacterium]